MLKNLLVIALAFAIFLSGFNVPTVEAAENYDLVIINARIVDGTGNPWFRGSVAVRGGKIVRVGRVDASAAKQTIDAQNKIVAPGFIDVHTHTEGIFNTPSAENFVRMGVTTLVTGNCGSSATDIKDFLGRFREKPLAVNLATLIAHGSVRSKVMGLDNRAPTPERRRRAADF